MISRSPKVLTILVIVLALGRSAHAHDPVRTSPAAPEPADANAASAENATLPCSCGTTFHSNGWCERHKLGYVAGVPIRSFLLWETLDAHGHQLDLSTFTCESC